MQLRKYQFVPVTDDQYPMIFEWLGRPHVQAWWGIPEEELALIREDRKNGAIDMRIVHVDGKPFAYIQDYPADHWPLPHYAGLPKGTRAIDTFIAETDMLGHGHGAAYLRQRASELIEAGAPKVVIDPDPKNHHAIRAYRSAGFTGDQVRAREDGDPVLVLEFNPD